MVSFNSLSFLLSTCWVTINALPQTQISKRHDPPVCQWVDELEIMPDDPDNPYSNHPLNIHHLFQAPGNTHWGTTDANGFKVHAWDKDVIRFSNQGAQATNKNFMRVEYTYTSDEGTTRSEWYWLDINGECILGGIDYVKVRGGQVYNIERFR